MHMHGCGNSTSPVNIGYIGRADRFGVVVNALDLQPRQYRFNPSPVASTSPMFTQPSIPSLLLI